MNINESSCSDVRNALILGFGSDILTDDGIGYKIVMELEEHFRFSIPVTYKTLLVGGLDIPGCIEGYHTVIFIDAIKTTGAKPGTIHYFTPENFMETFHLSNLHDVSFLTALKTAEAVGIKLPENIYIIAVEISEFLTFSDSLTCHLQKNYKNIVEEIKNKISFFLNAGSQDNK